MGDTEHGVRKLIIRGTVLLVALLFFLFQPELLIRLFTYPLWSFRVYHVIWLMTVLVLIRRLIPQMNRKVSSGKIFEKNYRPIGESTPGREAKLAKYKRMVDAGAIKSALYWSLVIGAAGLSRYLGILSTPALFIVVIFFIFMDQFCVTVWCPFKWIVKNKCCKTCRINNWGYFMAFSPLVWVPSFWTYSVLLLSAAVIGQWEVLFQRHPERFFEGYNATLSCRTCLSPCPKN